MVEALKLGLSIYDGHAPAVIGIRTHQYVCMYVCVDQFFIRSLCLLLGLTGPPKKKREVVAEQVGHLEFVFLKQWVA